MNIPFKTEEKEFEDKTAVRIWMRNNQTGRRNLTPAWRIELALGNKADLKVKMGRPTNEEKLSLSQYDKHIEPHNTQKKIAEKAGVSTGQVGMAEVVKKESPEMWEEAKSGDIGIATAYNKIRKEQKEIAKSKQINLHTTQKYREAEEIEAIESERASDRLKLSGELYGKGTPKLAEPMANTGETREKVAEAVGMKRSTFEAGKKVYIAAKDGNEKAQTLMKQLDTGQDKGLLQCNNPSQHMKVLAGLGVS